MTLTTGVGRGFGGGRWTGWTPTQDARIRELAALDYSVREVAKEFGVTRNAIIGRARRMKPPVKWALRPAAIRPPGSPAPVRRRGGQRRRYFRGNPAPEPPAPANAPPSQDVAVLDLKEHHCRYPYGEFAPYLFCGAAPQKGHSYCAFHQALTTCVRPVRTPPSSWPTTAAM